MHVPDRAFGFPTVTAATGEADGRAGTTGFDDYGFDTVRPAVGPLPAPAALPHRPLAHSSATHLVTTTSRWTSRE